MSILNTIDSVLAAGSDWYTRITGAVATVKAVWAGVLTIAARHPELSADVHDTFTAVVNGLQTKSPTAIFTTVADVQKAYADFAVAYTGERGAVVDLLAKLKALAS